MHEKGPCNLALRANPATAFLEAIGAWLRLSPFQRRHHLFGKKPPAWPKRVGTPWAYLICAKAMAHACALKDVRFEGTDSGWVQSSVPAKRGSQVVVLGLPAAGTWESVTLALSSTSPHVSRYTPGITAVRTPPGMYICFRAGANVSALGGVLADLLRDEWQEKDEEEESEPELPEMDTDSDPDDGDLAEWIA